MKLMNWKLLTKPEAWNAFFISKDAFFIALPKCCQCILGIRECDDNFLCRHAIKWKLNVKGGGGCDLYLAGCTLLIFCLHFKMLRVLNQLPLLLVVYTSRSQRQGLGTSLGLLKLKLLIWRAYWLWEEDWSWNSLASIANIAPVSSPFLS